MGKLKSMFIGAAAVGCVILSGTSTAAGEFMRGAAYYTAGVSVSENSAQTESSKPAESVPLSESCGGTSVSGSESTSSTESSVSSAGSTSAASEPAVLPTAQKRGRIITKNRTEGTDDTDYSEFTDRDGVIDRYNFGYFDDPNIITLPSGAQIRNCTEEDNAELLAEFAELSELSGNSENGSTSLADEPQVLIYHTHTSESFLPYGDGYDSDYPIRSSDCSRNITAVGDALCEALARRGISSVHDCRVHDYPMFTGAYYRSAETLLEDLEEYPSIKIAIDLHRDGIQNDDASVAAPVAEINGKTAAQFMIITGCDSPETVIPDYIKNFRIACLIQDSAEELYPTLARPVLFDYRDYNQSLFAGSVLIEVGSQGNSLGEAVYTGELLGDVLAKAVYSLSEQ